MAFYYGHATDRRYLESWVPSGSAETGPRVSTVSMVAPTAGVVYAMRVRLDAKAYTTVTFGTSTQGVTLANTFFGLYDTAFARVAVSADVSATVAAVGAGTTGTVTLAYTPTVQDDFYLAFVIGSAATMPQFPVVGEGGTQVKVHSLTSRLAFVHGTTGQTALPATITPSDTAATQRNFWLRIG